MPKTRIFISVFMVISAITVMAVDNNDFSAGLLHWKTAWHVTVADNEAVLTDTNDYHSFMFQADNPGTGPFTLSFDFFNGLSANVPPGRFRDSFYASLYYVDNLSDFITEHDRFDNSDGVMDADAGGTFNIRGTITPVTNHTGWIHFSGTFTNNYTYAIIMFELYSLNATPGDSSIRIDNVIITNETAP